MDYGLALGGGGTRGAAHVGVLLALKEEGVLPSSIAGTSAGSIVAGCFASGMEPEELWETVLYLQKYGRNYLDPEIAGLALLLPQILLRKTPYLSGLLKGRRLNRLLCTLTDKKVFEKLDFPVLIPAVDIKTGDTICFTNMKGQRAKKNHPFKGCVQWIEQGRLCDAMMASSSVPGVFSPFKMSGYILVDGGVTDNLPVNLMIAAGVKEVMAVDVGTNYEMPNDDCIFEIVSHSFSIMSGSLKECHSKGERLLLKPKITEKAGLLTFQHMEQCMEEAYFDTKKMADTIRKTFGR